MSATTLTEILDLLARGSLVLAPNARAARTLRLAFDQAQQTRGLTAWEPASVLSWTQWTGTLWTDLVVAGHEPRLLLNEAQEHILWREVVSSASDAASLASADALADLARSAWNLAAAYNATPQLHAFASTQDARKFAEWAAAFTKLCATRQCLSAALLDGTLRQHLQSSTLTAPHELHLAGFTPLLPAQHSLLEALTQRGSDVHHHTLHAEPVDLHASTIASTERDELTLAARFIRSFLEARPTASIAILVPNLPDERPALESTFRNILAPELQSIHADLSSTPWEFTTGAPLSSIPLIADALDLARFALTPLPLGRVSSLLLSPYLGSLDDHAASAAFDATRLRRALLLRPEITLASLLTLNNRASDAIALPSWVASVHRFLTNVDRARPRTYADWTELLRALLKSANWPGDRPLSPTELEATRAWDSTLDLIATLDFAGRRVPIATALQALDRQIRAAAFTPPSTNAPIQIMSPAESIGTFFDATIFLHATDTNLPAAARPNPLLGWPLQQSLRMPGTDPALASADALAFTQDLLARSNTVLFTHARENADGQLRPSPLITQLNLPHIDADDIAPPAPAQEPITTEATPDALALPPLPSPEVRGGSRVLKLQAACGFLAFAELRLLSTELESRSAGFDARESGSLLHNALQLFWTEVPSRAALAALSEDDRKAILIACIDRAIPQRALGDAPWDLAYLTLQKDRLRQLLLHWLDHELERGPFTVINSEREELITVGPLTLQVRMDRIDKIATIDEHGEEKPGYVFVDYKTGARSDAKDWLGPRPDDPQLPLYALASEATELQALVFAKVRAGKDAKWTGYQSTPGIFPDKRGKSIVALDQVIDDWRNTLTQLAEDFHAGRATVSPKDFDRNCAHCAQRLLCRIDPESLLAQIAATEDEEDGDANG
jgi:ATP-dependent helicase/nuclease subunit B